jgi:hypothetical protein
LVNTLRQKILGGIRGIELKCLILLYSHSGIVLRGYLGLSLHHRQRQPTSILLQAQARGVLGNNGGFAGAKCGYVFAALPDVGVE